jgi:hypothetical protein
MAPCAKYETVGRRKEELDTTAMRKETISDHGHSFGNPGSGISLISSALPEEHGTVKVG